MSTVRRRLLSCVSLLAMAVNAASPALAATTAANDAKTTTPIKHVIVIIGENRTFDHLFATYQPPKKGQTVSNLLSKHIINADGTPGTDFYKAAQYQASDTTTYSIAPLLKKPYNTLPPMLSGSNQFASNTNPPPFASTAVAAFFDFGLEPADIPLLTTGAPGLPFGAIDTRIGNAAAPANGPVPLTGPQGTLTYDGYAASPVHRFYQMFQQMDCSLKHAEYNNPTGCLNDLFPWVETSVGAGSDGQPQPAGFNNTSTHEGATAMGFYNVQNGDMPYFKMLADTYALGDNYHQPVKGGTGANSVMLGYATDVWYADPVTGKPGVPPANQIENPDPQAGTNNFYKNDGYGGGTYSNCSDSTQPGVKSVNSYLKSLQYKTFAACVKNAYYLLNNYNPGFNGDGSLATLGANSFTIPPVTQRSIANTLDEAKVSWTYYGEGWTGFVNNTLPGNAVYCNICNPFLYQSYVMKNPAKRANNLKDTTDLYTDLANGTLPAVSWVKPGGLNDGHPASSKFNIFEAYTKKILDMLQANPKLWAETAVFITVDEGGGYYDSGFEQTIDFFGDGTRIPMLVVSPYSKGVGMVHSYGDHASFIKFVNRNWILPPIDKNTRDNLPNPIQPNVKGDTAYIPVNMPAIDDLLSYFSFGSHYAN